MQSFMGSLRLSLAGRKITNAKKKMHLKHQNSLISVKLDSWSSFVPHWDYLVIILSEDKNSFKLKIGRVSLYEELLN